MHGESGLPPSAARYNLDSSTLSFCCVYVAYVFHCALKCLWHLYAFTDAEFFSQLLLFFSWEGGFVGD